MSRATSLSGNLAVKATGYLLLIFSILAILHGILGLKNSFKQGRFGLIFEQENSMVISGFAPGYPAAESGLKINDRITKVNGKVLDQTTQNQTEVWGEAIAGTQITVTVIRGQQEQEYVLTRKLNPLIDRIIAFLFRVLIPCLMLAYILVGLWGISVKPSFITNLIALVCFCFGLMILSIHIPGSETLISRYFFFTQIKDVLSLISIYMTPAMWLFLFINFPQKAGFYRKYPKLTIFLIFVIPLSGILGSYLLPGLFEQSNALLLFFTLYMTGFISAGITILSKGAKEEKNMLKRRQYHLMLFGIKYGALSIFSGFILLVIYMMFLRTSAQGIILTILFIFLVTQVMGLILPFTFLNTFFQKKILETQSALKRKLRYIGATSMLFLIYLISIFFVGKMIVSAFELKDPSLIVFLMLLLSFTFIPINSHVHSRLEERLYPEKTKYKKMLSEMVRKLSSYIDTTQVFESISQWISKTMDITPVLAICFDGYNCDASPINRSSGKSVIQKTRDGSNFFWDEIIEGNDPSIDILEKQWAIDNGISLSIPMISRGEQVGLLNIGKKRNDEDYSGDDLEIFREVAHHTAIAIQNINLQSEHLEKKRMDRELEVARNIQNLLLPKKIGDSDSLQLFGAYRPCFEVGGDYFDIIQLDKARTALVVADVSGKGAGAALLMSNLQASLRMALSVSLPLSEMVCRINNMVCENSLATQFITFFIGIWNMTSQNFHYINAGHNPPLILKSNGSIEKLLPTGIGLGIRKNREFVEKECSLLINDLLTIYTDGIEEYFNHNIEQFGLDRIISILKDNRQFHPKAIIQTIFDELERFSCGKAPVYSDDLTIIIGKRIN